MTHPSESKFFITLHFVSVRLGFYNLRVLGSRKLNMILQKVDF